MNREIKFRAWDEANRVMHHDFQYVKSGNDGNDWILFASDKQPISQTGPRWHENPYFSQQLKVMQYTGLKDKNGVEIYEGDIVRFNGFCENGDDFIAEIEFKFNLFLGWLLHKDHEVIGNVYENPELLESEGVR